MQDLLSRLVTDWVFLPTAKRSTDRMIAPVFASSRITIGLMMPVIVPALLLVYTAFVTKLLVVVYGPDTTSSVLSGDLLLWILVSIFVIMTVVATLFIYAVKPSQLRRLFCIEESDRTTMGMEIETLHPVEMNQLLDELAYSTRRTNSHSYQNLINHYVRDAKLVLFVLYANVLALISILFSFS